MQCTRTLDSVGPTQTRCPLIRSGILHRCAQDGPVSGHPVGYWVLDLALQPQASYRGHANARSWTPASSTIPAAKIRRDLCLAAAIDQKHQWPIDRWNEGPV